MNEQQMIPVWNEDSKFALNFNKFICWPLGLWPLDYDSAFSDFRLLYSFVSQLWFIYVQIAPAYLHCGSASDVVDYVMMTVCSFMAIFKMITFRLYMKDFRAVFLSAMNDWINVVDAEDRLVMRSFAKSGRLVFKLQIGFCYLSNTIIVIGTLPFLAPSSVPTNGTFYNVSDTTETTVVRELPVKSGCLFGHYRDEIYGFFYVYESIMINITAHGNVGCDVFLFSLLMHLCGQIELIKKDLREIGSPSLQDYTRSKEKIEKFIDKHVKLLDMAAAIVTASSGMLVVQLFCNAGLNLMLGLRVLIALKNNTFFDAIRPLFALNVLMLQLYLLCYASERLSSQSESILEALYDSKWYELPLKLRKNLYFIAMRANKSMNLVAGQFYVFNLENFKNILKASFSYFSILRVMFDN